MKFIEINYKDLKPKQQEIYNFQKVSAVLAEYGFNCIKLADDWQGADFLAYHKDGSDTLKVQLKGRVHIDGKYSGKEIYMAFPIDEYWCVIHHDKLIDLVKEHTPWLNSDVWKNTKRYTSGSPNKKLKLALQQYVLKNSRTTEKQTGAVKQKNNRS